MADLGGVGVIKADGHVAAVERRDVIVEQRRLGMANMHVAAGLRGEPRLHFALHHVTQVDLE